MNEWIRSIGEKILTVKNQIIKKKVPILSTINPTEIGLGLNPALLFRCYYNFSSSQPH
jgi:hypothetical protein